MWYIAPESIDIYKHVKAYLLYILGCILVLGLPRIMVLVDYIKLLEKMLRVEYFTCELAMLDHLHGALKLMWEKGRKTF